jgi:hypothetical protein
MTAHQKLSEERKNYALHFSCDAIFTHAVPRSAAGNNLEPEHAKRGQGKKSNRAGATPLFGLSAAQKVFGVAPALRHTNRACPFFPGQEFRELLDHRTGGNRKMPLIKKQAVIVPREIRIESSVADLLDDYARFIDSSPDHVVNSVLKKLWRDPEYRKWRDERRNAQHTAQTAPKER